MNERTKEEEDTNGLDVPVVKALMNSQIPVTAEGLPNSQAGYLQLPIFELCDS